MFSPGRQKCETHLWLTFVLRDFQKTSSSKSRRAAPIAENAAGVYTVSHSEKLKIECEM